MFKIGKRQAICLMVSGGVLLIGGIVLTAISGKNKLEHEIDYTDIGNCNYLISNATCPDHIKSGSPFCICIMDFNLPVNFSAPVNIYYELESFDQSSIAESRDNNQLSGKLSLEPSTSCGNYTKAVINNVTKPIAPCGALADAFFNDTYNIYHGEKLYNTTPGVLSPADKTGYKNPPGNLTEALLNFTQPINWHESEWEEFLLENAFENEKFIGWMHTDWKRKPYAQINETLLAGSYKLEVGYYYPPSRYSGIRKLILTSSIIEYKCSYCVPVGITLLVIACLTFLCGLVAMLLLTKHKNEFSNVPQRE